MTVYLNDFSMISALGHDLPTIRERLFSGDVSGMVSNTGWLVGGRAAKVGQVTGALPEIPGTLQKYASRNNRLLVAALKNLQPTIDAVVDRYGKSRIAIVLGTSTSGIEEAEKSVAAQMHHRPRPASYHYAQQEIGSPAEFLARHLDFPGIAYVVSTACTSSAKAMAASYRLLKQGLCDAVITGGVDSLCRLTLNGFESLESISPNLSLPLSANRCGINIGEGAALFVATRDPGPVAFIGYGESSDAWHMSSPHPEGNGAEAAMRQALRMAGVTPDDIGYVNLHGTATLKNDAMESLAMQRVFPQGVPVSSTKPLVGHALGAAGAIEAGFAWLTLTDLHRRLPPHVWDGAVDPSMPPLRLVCHGDRLPASHGLIMSNSYAFGGSNVSLLLAKNSGPP